MTEVQATEGNGVDGVDGNGIILPPKLVEAFAPIKSSPFGPMLEPIEQKLSDHYALVRANDRHVFDIQNNKEKDPKNVEIQDAAWERAIEDGTATPQMIAAEKRYQKAVEAMMKEKDVLRAAVLADVKKYIGEALPEEEIVKLRKLVNTSKDTLKKSEAGAITLAEMADKMLVMPMMADIGAKPVENGVWSLMPEPASLLNSRGKKADSSGSDGKTNATRCVKVELDGKEIVRERNKRDGSKEVIRPHFNHLAEELSKKWNAAQFDGNAVTSEELEKAYYDSKGVEWREQTSMPVTHEFDFSKDVEVQNPNDDSTTLIPNKVKLTITRWTPEWAAANVSETADSTEANTDKA